MKITSLNRRLSRRLSLKTPLRVRIWKSSASEESAESLNLSQNGVYFATNTPIREGETVEILLNMPEEISDEPSTEWRCTGHVVRVEPVDSAQGKLGVGVQFDCYEVSRVELPVGSSDTASEAMAEAIFSAR
jgi:Tfp pilus assembly protein PilZ